MGRRLIWMTLPRRGLCRRKRRPKRKRIQTKSRDRTVRCRVLCHSLDEAVKGVAFWGREARSCGHALLEIQGPYDQRIRDVIDCCEDGLIVSLMHGQAEGSALGRVDG